MMMMMMMMISRRRRRRRRRRSFVINFANAQDIEAVFPHKKETLLSLWLAMFFS
jgi:hypothetical protein